MEETKTTSMVDKMKNEKATSEKGAFRALISIASKWQGGGDLVLCLL